MTTGLPVVTDLAPETLPRHRSWRPLAAAGVTMVLWASAFVVIRALSGAVSPGPLALGRLLVGSLVLTAVALLRPGRGPLRIPRGRPLVLIVAYGVLWFGVYTVAVNAAGSLPRRRHQRHAGEPGPGDRRGARGPVPG